MDKKNLLTTEMLIQLMEKSQLKLDSDTIYLPVDPLVYKAYTMTLEELQDERAKKIALWKDDNE